MAVSFQFLTHLKVRKNIARNKIIFFVPYIYGDMEIEPSIELTADGTQTLRHPLTGETYHSTGGAGAESEHVFIRAGFDACERGHVRILEVGFGSGLNALLTLRAAKQAGRTVEYTAIELYPVSQRTVEQMALAEDADFRLLHAAPWGVPTEISDGFVLHKIEGDLADTQFGTTFDLVYFDAFAPDCQPELWTQEVFARIYGALEPGGLLVTYSAKGDVKRALREVGFTVRRLPGAVGKRHMIRAEKNG